MTRRDRRAPALLDSESAYALGLGDSRSKEEGEGRRLDSTAEVRGALLFNVMHLCGQAWVTMIVVVQRSVDVLRAAPRRFAKRRGHARRLQANVSRRSHRGRLL